MRLLTQIVALQAWSRWRYRPGASREATRTRAGQSFESLPQPGSQETCPKSLAPLCTVLPVPRQNHAAARCDQRPRLLPLLASVPRSALRQKRATIQTRPTTILHASFWASARLFRRTKTVRETLHITDAIHDQERDLQRQRPDKELEVLLGRFRAEERREAIKQALAKIDAKERKRARLAAFTELSA
jgi:hypothetical protein